MVSCNTAFENNLQARDVLPEFCTSPSEADKSEASTFEDPFDLDDWDMSHSSRCFVHIANSLVWRSITGESPPTTPYTAKEYTKYGLPWFEYYSDNATALNGSKELEKLKSVADMAREKGEVVLPENEPVDPRNIVKLREGMAKDQVREGSF